MGNYTNNFEVSGVVLREPKYEEHEQYGRSISFFLDQKNTQGYSMFSIFCVAKRDDVIDKVLSMRGKPFVCGVQGILRGIKNKNNSFLLDVTRVHFIRNVEYEQPSDK